MKAATVFSAS